jgi:hypothetical protein
VELVSLSLVASSGFADAVDIKGYVYYQDYDEPYTYEYGPDSASGYVAYPIDGAYVSLYKRTSSDTWVQYGSTIQTDEGYYVFEDIDVGRDETDLCTNSNWFRIRINAEGCLPYGWQYMEQMVRFSNKAVRPSGIPDAGDIRVDCVFEACHWDEYDGSSLQADALQGHWVAEDNGTAFSLAYSNGELSCPIDQNVIQIQMCFVGHVGVETVFSTWDDEEDYSELVVWPYGEDESEAVGWFYQYWSADWPSYAFHVNQAVPPQQYIIMDFIDP